LGGAYLLAARGDTLVEAYRLLVEIRFECEYSGLLSDLKIWRTTFNEDLYDMELTWMGAKRSASDRPKWRKLVARCSSRNWRN